MIVAVAVMAAWRVGGDVSVGMSVAVAEGLCVSVGVWVAVGGAVAVWVWVGKSVAVGFGVGVADGVMAVGVGDDVAVGNNCTAGVGESGRSVASNVGATVGVTSGGTRLQALMTSARIRSPKPRRMTTVAPHTAKSSARYPVSSSSNSVPT